MRYKPFTHVPGSWIPVPGTHLSARVFPTLIELSDGKNVSSKKITCRGPFVAHLDLEKGDVIVGKNSVKELFGLEVSEAPRERLMLGSNKAQKWERVVERKSFREFAPFWLRLGLWTPPVRVVSEGSLVLMGEFNKLFDVGFKGILMPKLEDDLHLGYDLPNVTTASPWAILAEGAKQIRALYISEDGNTIHPKGVHGRLLNVPFALGEYDLIWSQSKVRQMELRVTKDGEQSFTFPSDIKQFRLRTHLHKKGNQVQAGTPLSLKANSTYWLDNFKK